MRAIKFRAWHFENKEMYVVDEINHIDSWSCVGMLGINGVRWTIWIQGWAQNDCVLLQFIWLLDKDGNEIFEGDIVNVPSFEPSIYEVVFNRGWFCMRQGKDDDYYPDGKYLEDGEIIGNIYDTPELLK